MLHGWAAYSPVVWWSVLECFCVLTRAQSPCTPCHCSLRNSRKRPRSRSRCHFIHHGSLRNTATVLLCVWRILWCFSFQTVGLEVASGFQPRLISTQPHPARPPLPEFFLQLGPGHHTLLRLNDGTVTLLRDFNPVRRLHFKIRFISLFHTITVQLA